MRVAQTDLVWTGAHGRLWMHPDNHPEFLIYSGIFRMLWNSGRNPRVIVYGYLPQAKWILNTPEYFDLEARGGLCLDPTDYKQGKRMSIMTGCHVIQKWIPGFVSLDEDNPITAFINIECSSIEVFA